MDLVGSLLLSQGFTHLLTIGERTTRWAEVVRHPAEVAWIFIFLFLYFFKTQDQNSDIQISYVKKKKKKFKWQKNGQYVSVFFLLVCFLLKKKHFFFFLEPLSHKNAIPFIYKKDLVVVIPVCVE